MFTGLIEETGEIQAVDTTAEGSRIAVSAKKILKNCQVGDSIAIDGVCTTVVSFTEESFTIEATPETLSKTTFGSFEVGRPVNLERPLLPTSRLGGHFVTGHVDGTATVLSRVKHGNSWVFRFRLDNPELVPYVVEKGSIAVSGISLTINTVIQDAFSVAIIPHTLAETNMDVLAPGDKVNIETDLIGKYIVNLARLGRLPTDFEAGAFSGFSGFGADVGNPSVMTPPTTSGTRIHSGDWFCHDDSLLTRER